MVEADRRSALQVFIYALVSKSFNDLLFRNSLKDSVTDTISSIV